MPESARRSADAISHSLRSAFRTACAAELNRIFSSRRRIPHSALKCGIIRGARNVALPRQLAVIDFASPENFVLEQPCVGTLRVLLYVPRHARVPPAADGNI